MNAVEINGKRFVEFSPHEIEAARLAADTERACRNEKIASPGCALDQVDSGSPGRKISTHHTHAT